MLGNLFGPKKDQAPQMPPSQMAPGAPGMVSPQQSGMVADPNQMQQPLNGMNGAGMLPPQGQIEPQNPNQPPLGAPAASPAVPPPTTSAGADITGSKMDPALRQNLSALSHLDTRSTQILQNAHKEAVRTKQQHIEPEQILLGLLYDEGIFQLFDQFSVDVAKISRDLQQKEIPQNFTGQPTLSNDSVQIFEQAYRGAKARGVGFVEPIDILMAIYTVNKKLAEYLKAEGVGREQLEEKLQKSGEYTAAKKSTLERYGVDLTAEAAAGKLDPVVGRDKEVDRLIHILLRRTKNNPIIIGEAGVGKTAIIEGLAQQIVSGQVPPDLAKKRIIQLDVSSLVAGASRRGEFEERLREVVKDAMASQGQMVLFIDEIHTLIGAGGDGGAMDASNIIKPHLARGHLQLIGTTTTAEYRKYFEKDKAFERRFQPIIAEEPDEETAIKMLQVLRPKFEKYHGVVITDEAIEASVKLSKKYIGERYLPDKAVDLLDEASAEVKLGSARGKALDAMGVEETDEGTGAKADKLKKDDTGKPEDATNQQASEQTDQNAPQQGSDRAQQVQVSQNQQQPADTMNMQNQGMMQQQGPQDSNPNAQQTGIPQTQNTDPNAASGNTAQSAQNPNDPNTQANQGEHTASTDSNAVNPASDAAKTGEDASWTDGVQSLAEATEADKIANSAASGSGASNEVHKRDIERVVASWTGIPVTKLTEDEGKKLLELEKRIHQRLIDQEQAVNAVSEAVRRGRIGLASGARPIASFIFLGPSGTGKTELAKTLSEILFGRDDAIIRLDMSEYMEKHEVAKLIGAPPGYVGYEEGGQLTEAVRAKPYSIVLLDEVEKAHPDVFNILLQLLEDGRLTDNKGNTISFKNTIVICTSNIGSQMIVQKLGEKDKNVQRSAEQEEKDYQELSGQVNEELRKFFRPELLNRFDDIVIFKPLRRQDMAGIAKLGIKKTAKLLKEQGYGVQITDRGLQQLAKEGYDPMYGARPLRRLIQTSIENPIALLIIGKTFELGDIILIDYDPEKNEYVFRKSGKKLTDEKAEKMEGKDMVKDDGTEKPADAPSGQQTDPNSQNISQPGVPSDPNSSGQTLSAPQNPQNPQHPQGGAGYAMGVPAQQVNPANVPVGVEALLGNAASAPVEKPFDPLALVSSSDAGSDQSTPAVGSNPTPTPQAPVTDNGAQPATS